MLKILHVYRTFFPDTQGGIEETIRQVAKGTRELGADARVLTVSKNFHKERRIIFEGLEVFQVPELIEVASCNIPRQGVGTFRGLAQWADVVHFHFPWPVADLVRSLVPGDTSVVVTYHSDIIRQRVLSGIYAPLMHHFFNSVDRIISTSPNYLATSPVLRRYAKNVEVIPIGIDPASYPAVSASKVDETESMLGSQFFLFVGVLRYYKGLNILLEASVDADFHVVIVGSGPIERELKAKAKELGLDNVSFLGRVDDPTKVALLSLCRAVVFPSYLRSEAFGVTLLEGAMYGKPLISAEIGTGTSYVNKHKETGLVVPPSDSHSLRAAMDCLHNDEAFADDLGKGARARFEALFTAKDMCRKYYDVYTELVSSRTEVIENCPGDSSAAQCFEQGSTLENNDSVIDELGPSYSLNPNLLTVSTVLYKTGEKFVVSHLEALGLAADRLYAEAGVFCHLFLIDNSSCAQYFEKINSVTNAARYSAHLKISVMRSPGNIGYGRANNLALPLMHSRYHLITNPDVIVAPDALLQSYSYMEKHECCGLLTPKVDCEAEGVVHVVKDYPDCFSLALRYLGSRRLAARFERRLKRYERSDIGEAVAPVDLAGGCFLFMRSQQLIDMGGFDERFFMYFEDFDLSLRIKRSLAIHFVPGVKIIHYGGDVGRKGTKHHLYFIVSAWKFFNKHGWKFF